jgi:hypothetical protein
MPSEEVYSDDWWLDRNDQNRCVAIRKNGKRYLKPANHGMTVCRTHGGAAPQVQRKAKQRLELAADRMARELLGMATGAESEAVKLAAVKDALDRAGLAAKTEVAVEVAQEPWKELLGDVMAITKAQHEAWKRGEYQPATPAPLPDPPALAARADDVLDAEVVEDPPESPPDSTGERVDAPPAPEWAEPPPASRTGQLVPIEQATAEAAAANRAARVSPVRRRRR